MTAPPELDELVARVLAEPGARPTPASELVGRAQRRRRQRRTRVAALGTIAAVVAASVVASVIAIDHPKQRQLEVVTEPTTTTTTPAPAAPVLHVTCGAHRSINVDAARIEARADGVHLRITFPPHHSRDFAYMTYGNTNGTGDGSGSTGIGGSGPLSKVEPLAPGRNVLACAGTTLGGPAPHATIDVVDPRHVWTPETDPECTIEDVRSGPIASRPRAAVRKWLVSVGHADAHVAVLGYPRAATRDFGITERGQVVARVNVIPSDDKWKLFSGGACRGFTRRT